MTTAAERDREDEAAVLLALRGLRTGLTMAALARVADMPLAVAETTIERLIQRSALSVSTVPVPTRGNPTYVYAIAEPQQHARAT